MKTTLKEVCTFFKNAKSLIRKYLAENGIFEGNLLAGIFTSLI